MQSTYKPNVHVRALTGLHIYVTPSKSAVERKIEKIMMQPVEILNDLFFIPY